MGEIGVVVITAYKGKVLQLHACSLISAYNQKIIDKTCNFILDDEKF